MSYQKKPYSVIFFGFQRKWTGRRQSIPGWHVCSWGQAAWIRAEYRWGASRWSIFTSTWWLDFCHFLSLLLLLFCGSGGPNWHWSWRLGWSRRLILKDDGNWPRGWGGIGAIFVGDDHWCWGGMGRAGGLMDIVESRYRIVCGVCPRAGSGCQRKNKSVGSLGTKKGTDTKYSWSSSKIK